MVSPWVAEERGLEFFALSPTPIEVSVVVQIPVAQRVGVVFEIASGVFRADGFVFVTTVAAIIGEVTDL